MTRCLVVLVFLCAAASARGQSSRDVEDARRHADIGQSALGRGDFAGARDAFRQAHQLFPSPLLLLNIARAEVGLGHNAEAIRTLRAALADTSLGEPRRQEAVAEVERLRPLVSELRIAVTVEGATIAVGGRSVGTSPLSEPVFVDAGHLAVTARAEGHLDATWSGEVVAGDSRSIELDPEVPVRRTAVLPPPHVDETPAAPARPPRVRRSEAQSSSLPWTTGTIAGLAAVTWLGYGAVMWASCGSTRCADDTLQTPALVLDVTLGATVLVSGAITLFLILRGDEAPQ